MDIYPITLKTPAERAHFFELIVYSYARQPEMRRRAQEILRDAGVKRPDADKTAAAIFDWVQHNVPYILEAGEQIETPAWVLREGVELGADCDGHAILVATLLESVGIRSDLVYWTAPGQTGATHVSAAYFDGVAWINLDTTQERPLGWAPPGHTYQLGTRPEIREAMILTTKGETRHTREPGAVPELGGLLADAIGAVKSVGSSIYSGAKAVGSAVAGAGAGVVRAAAEIMRQIPGIGDALAAATIAILETVESFVQSTLGWLEDIGGRAFTLFSQIVTRITDWAADWRTWSRLVLSVLVCAGGAAVAGTVSAGGGAVAVVTVCASSWAQTEISAMALDIGTPELERIIGMDLPDYLEPGNLARVVTAVKSWDWSAAAGAAETSAAEAARVAMTYAEAELRRQVNELPGAIATRAKALALAKIRQATGFDQLPAAARGAIEQAITTRGASLASLTPERLRAELTKAAAQVSELPPFDELATDVQEDLGRAIAQAGEGIPGFSEASARVQAQMVDLATAKAELIQEVMERTAGASSWSATADVVARLDASIDATMVAPLARDLFTEAGLDSVLPLTVTELSIMRRAGGWTGDTGARMLLEGRYTPEQIIHRSGSFEDPVRGARAVLKFRLEGPSPNREMVRALQASGAPIITQEGRFGVVSLEPEETSLVGPLVGSALGAAAATWLATRKRP